MPILAVSSGTITAIWGAAYIRLPNGKMKLLQPGDKVAQGAQILTTMDGIVEILPDRGEPLQVAASARTDLLADQEPPGAGLAGGPNGGLLPGLRVERVSETVGPLAFEFATARDAQGS